MKPEISIIIPVYNEQGNVEILFNEIRNAMGSQDQTYEIIFVDDGSSDSTYRILEAMKEKYKGDSSEELRIIKLSRNFGQTAAMQVGFDCSEGKIIISMDGDLQNDPKDIPKLLDMLSKGCDVVCGWRKKREDHKLTRIVPSKVANWMIGKITGIPIHDNGCSLKAYKSSVIKSVRLYSDMHRFIPAITTMIGAKVEEIVVNHRPRIYGETKYGLSRIWKVMFDIITIKMLIHFHKKPMVWFAIFASAFCFLGIWFGIASILIFLNGGQSIVFMAASFLCFFLFGSLCSWGLLAEYCVDIEFRTNHWGEFES